MSILIFLKPPYSTGDNTGTKKVLKVLTLVSANLGELKKDEKLCEKDAMWQTVPEMKNYAYKFTFALKQLLPIFSHKMA